MVFCGSSPMGSSEPNKGIRIGGGEGWVKTTSGTSGTTPRMNFDRIRWVTLPIRVHSSGNRLKKGDSNGLNLSNSERVV